MEASWLRCGWRILRGERFFFGRDGGEMVVEIWYSAGNGGVVPLTLRKGRKYDVKKRRAGIEFATV